MQPLHPEISVTTLLILDGMFKAMMLCYHDIITQYLQLRRSQALDSGEQFPHPAVMLVYHISGLVQYIHYPVLTNAYCHIPLSFTMELMLRKIVEYPVREVILVPSIIVSPRSRYNRGEVLPRPRRRCSAMFGKIGTYVSRYEFCP